MKPLPLRIFLGLLRRVFYHLTVLHPDHVPAQGGALLVSNHMSFVDALLILASTDRWVRFLLPQRICARWWLRPFLAYLQVIPLPPDTPSSEAPPVLTQAREALRRGEVLGLFAEQSISRIGVILPFARAFERITAHLGAPVIPVCLDGLWGSVFSFQRGRFFWKLPRQLPYPITVSFGQPLPPMATAFEVRTAIQELNTDAWPYRRRTMKPLHRAFVRRARRGPRLLAWADARVPRLTYGGALTRLVFLARRLRAPWAGQNMVGILLPPSVAGALVNFAALLMGKIPVNLNYLLTEETLNACACQCQLKTILTSRAFLDRIKVKTTCRTLLLEEVAAHPRLTEKLLAGAWAWFAPVGRLERAVGRLQPAALDDLATVIFSSGSTGEPKGIMLSHYNIVSNAEQLGQMFNLGPRDRFLGVLPFFHSFGFTATLMTPALFGVGVVYHPNPLDAKPIGDLVRRYGVTYLMATPTFLQLYLRSCEPGDFGSLRLVMVGAEKLPEKLADAFEEKYGVRPMEGYGCTECSPVVTGNTFDYRAAGLRQVGSRRGSIGRPLPGVSVRVVDPETGAPVPLGRSGLLLVRGPNVMRGYLDQPAKTAQVFRDGWYVTGDIATLHEDGFLQITDRMSRFSKIGGEMVPHVKVEEKLQEAAGVNEITFVVHGVPDARKNERLVVLHTLPDDRVEITLKRLRQLGLPPLWIPRPNHFFRVETLPRLASGKMDLRTIREMAQRFTAEQESAGPPQAHV